MNKNVIIIGYSGHSFEIIESVMIDNFHIEGYCEPKENILILFQFNIWDSRKKPKSLLKENHSSLLLK